ncbi:MAG: alkaline phosphatase family protein, partial [Candidatus Krumholzibacteriia bacterium]
GRFAGAAGLAVLVVVSVLSVPSAVHAYVGPGAGFALVSSFLTFVIAFFTAFFALFTYPARMAWRAVRRKRPESAARAKKVIMLGLDGLDPLITERLMDAGELPNFSKLKARGTYRRLGTANPAMSPVAWSSFATGSDASHHGIFDFLTRDRRTYLPQLSSSHVYGESRFWKLGPFRIPRGHGGVRFLRKSVSFWKILSDYGVFSTVLRVPITFPPEKIHGLVLAGMDVPDLRGTMGTFTFFTQSPAADKIGGMVIKLPQGNSGSPLWSELPGPVSPIDGKPIPLEVEIHRANGSGRARVRVGDQVFALGEREYSPWIKLTFKAAANIKMTGIARFYITQMQGDFGMYVTPIHIDPDKPVMPVSSPSVYSAYLSKLIGPYATLGLAEDTWAVNERVLDEDGFLKQAYLYYEERRKMWFHALKKLRKGMVCCVFDLSDRLQHICFRYLDADHPANAGKDTTRYKEALYDMYREMDKLLGETLAYEDKNTALFVLSDHGFKTFQRGVDLNTWLWGNGYLAVKDEAPQRAANPGGPGAAKQAAGPSAGDTPGGEYLSSVDWSKTRAYAIGLGGIYINLEGRERHGTVARAEAEALKKEIADKLLALDDPKRSTPAISGMTDVARDFKGPYRHDGPDLLVGFAEGYRVSWDCARGVVTGEVFEDNTKSWSGDHCMDPRVVPGILFSNLDIAAEEPRLMDLAPTVLELFGIRAPGHMVGRSLVSK